ncbi:MAG: DNA polymerase III subunit beta [Pseudomonadota bacterium]
MTDKTVEVEAAHLLPAMRVATKVVNSVDSLPILANALLVASGSALTITTTDLDCQFTQRIPAVCSGELAVTLSASKLASIASAVPKGGSIKFKLTDDSRIAVSCGRSRWLLPTLARGDFPLFPADEAKGELTIDGARLTKLFERTLPFVKAPGSHRYYLCGPYWHANEGRLTIAATNGHQIVRAIVQDVDWPDGAPPVILGAKSAAVIQALTSGGGEARVRWSAKRVCVTMGEATIDAKVIDGTYPNYARSIAPVEGEPSVFSSEDMRSAIGRLKISADQRDNAVAIDPTEEGLTLSMRSGDGSNEAREDIGGLPGVMPSTAFNVRYLETIFAALAADEIHLFQAGPRDGARLQAASADGVVATVMPMNR